MTKKRVREAAPVQVYLGMNERTLLERLARQLETTKSEILRRGLAALERDLLDPERHPALRLIGIAGEQGDGPDYDVAREHDRFLAESEAESWRPPPAAKKGRRGR